jgi:3-deoxy-D-manno-octulosonic-acid transferase
MSVRQRQKIQELLHEASVCVNQPLAVSRPLGNSGAERQAVGCFREWSPMSYLLDALYLLALIVLSPWLIYKSLTTGKYRRGLWRKFTGTTPRQNDDRPCAWFHGVSVGEIHLLCQLVALFRQHFPDWQCVVSTTTDTGFEEAGKRFPDSAVFYWPLDFSWAGRRALRRVKPSLVVLAEGELWPNFLLAARAAGIPVAVVNGRMSPRSARRCRWLRFLSRRVFASVDLFAAQTEEYAANFLALGAAAERVCVTGSVKFDGVEGERDNPRTRELARLLNIQAGDLVWIAGSTQAPEEEIALEIFRRARSDYPRLRLLIVPRQRERFEEVASMLRRSGESFLRRSEIDPLRVSPAHPIILVDTIGELGALWGLANVAFVGGSLDGKRGGQNMIEPSAYGAAVVFGPHVWNFRDTAARLVASGAAVQVADAAALEITVRRLLGDVAERARLGAAARQFVRDQQGATERTVELLRRLMEAQRSSTASGRRAGTTAA